MGIRQHSLLRVGIRSQAYGVNTNESSEKEAKLLSLSPSSMKCLWLLHLPDPLESAHSHSNGEENMSVCICARTPMHTYLWHTKSYRQLFPGLLSSCTVISRHMS
eukprot:589031-Amphidinium_carterae.1